MVKTSFCIPAGGVQKKVPFTRTIPTTFGLAVAILAFWSLLAILHVRIISSNQISLPSSSSTKTITTTGNSTYYYTETGQATTTTTANSTVLFPPPKSPYAYVFVLGGIDLDRPKYHIYLYGIYVLTHRLRKYGSKADCVLFYRMLHSSPHNDLPEHELEALNKLNIISRKLPKAVEDFYNIQLTKFRALALTQYRRVVYLDADLLPLANIDYLFELSDENVQHPTLIQPNLVLQGNRAPSNGGLFMLSPQPGDLELINSVIQSKEINIRNGGQFDETIGWGQEVGDWNGRRKNGTGWTFVAASGDQGLLWYLVAIIKKQVSVVVPWDTIQNWAGTTSRSNSNSSTGGLELKDVLHKPFSVPDFNYSWMKRVPQNPLSGVYHLNGPLKEHAIHGCNFTKWEASQQNQSPSSHWCYALKELSEQHDLRIDMLSVKVDGDTVHPNITRVFVQGKSLTNLLDW